MKYNPYYDQEQFQRLKYYDQPTLRLLDWGCKHLQNKRLLLQADKLREFLHQILLAQIEADLADLDLNLSISQASSDSRFRRFELSLDIGGLVESRATLIFPVHRRPGTPVFICLHGHQLEGRQWTITEGPAAALTQAGYACFCPDLLGLGDNRGKTEDARGNVTYDLVVHNALMLGWSLNGLRLWVLERWMHAIKNQSSFGEQLSSFACAGFSLGGEIALFLSALHKEIEPVYISGYACPWEASYWSKLHCKCAYLPGIMRQVNLAEIFKLIAPRPLAVEVGDHDQSFPWIDTKVLLEEVNAYYQKISSGQYFHLIVKESAHEFNCDSQTLSFLEKMEHEKKL